MTLQESAESVIRKANSADALCYHPFFPIPRGSPNHEAVTWVAQSVRWPVHNPVRVVTLNTHFAIQAVV